MDLENDLMANCIKNQAMRWVQHIMLECYCDIELLNILGRQGYEILNLGL